MQVKNVLEIRETQKNRSLILIKADSISGSTM